MIERHPDPALARKLRRQRFIASASGGDPAREVRPEKEKRSPIIDALVPGAFVDAFFDGLTIPASSGEVAAGSAAWFGLRSIDITNQTEIIVAGADFEMVSTDYQSASNVQWGDKFGNRAALVIGINLPIEEGQWKGAPCLIPSLVDANGNHGSRYLYWQTFPPGDYAAATPFKVYPKKHFGFLVQRVPYGRTLDMAFVMHRDEFNAAESAGGTINGYGNVKVHVGDTQHSTSFTV